MTAINKDIDRYLSQVKSHLPCRKADKDAILEDIKLAIFEFTENFETANIDDIYNRFGSPEEIAKAYLSDADPKKITKAINIRKVLVMATVIALALLAITFIITIIDNHSGKIIYYESGIVEEITKLLISSNFISTI